MFSADVPKAISRSARPLSAPLSAAAGSCASSFSARLAAATKRSWSGLSELGSGTPAASFSRPAARLPWARSVSSTCKVFAPPSTKPVIAFALLAVTSSLVVTRSKTASSTIGVSVSNRVRCATSTAAVMASRLTRSECRVSAGARSS